MIDAAARYFAAVVTDNADPDELGRLRVICPELYGEDGATEFPGWIAPRVPAGAGPASGWWFVPPVDAIVALELTPSGELRWTGSGWGQVNTVPEFLAGNYPRRSGFTSPEGGHTLALDEDAGLLVLVTDPADPDGPACYLSLNGEDGEAKIGLASGALFLVNGSQVVAMTPEGDTLVLDSANGITLAHQGGAEYLALTDGTAALAGTDVQITAGTATVTASAITLTSDPAGLAPTEPVILGTTFLTDLAAALPELQAAATAWGLPTVNTATLIANLATALAAGAPYLSTVTATE